MWRQDPGEMGSEGARQTVTAYPWDSPAVCCAWRLAGPFLRVVGPAVIRLIRTGERGRRIWLGLVRSPNGALVVMLGGYCRSEVAVVGKKNASGGS